MLHLLLGLIEDSKYVFLCWNILPVQYSMMLAMSVFSFDLSGMHKLIKNIYKMSICIIGFAKSTNVNMYCSIKQYCSLTWAKKLN